MELNEETLLQEVDKGLNGYIHYKTKHTRYLTPYQRWKQAVLTRIKVELHKEEVTMYPNGSTRTKDITELHQDMSF